MFDALRKVGVAAPATTEAVARAMLAMKRPLGDPDFSISQLAEDFSDSVRIRRRPTDWSVDRIDYLQECTETA
jgi:hypothetical protein